MRHLIRSQAKRARATTPVWARGPVLTIATVAFIATSICALYYAPAYLAEHWTAITPVSGDEPIEPKTIEAAQIVLLALGGVIGAIGVALSLSRHGDELKASSRDEERLNGERFRELRSRFVTLVQLLSDTDNPLSQLAAIHGIGALADDWGRIHRHDEVQACIAVITGYLRAPVKSEGSHDESLDRQVREAGFKTLLQHLRPKVPSAPGPVNENDIGWGAYIVDLSRITIESRLDLSGVKFHTGGVLDISNASIGGDGDLDLTEAEFQDSGSLHLDGLEISEGGTVNLTRARCAIAEMHLSGMTFNKGGVVDLTGFALHRRSKLHIENLTFNGGGALILRHALFCDTPIQYHQPHIGTNVPQNVITLYGARFNGGGRIDLTGLVPSRLHRKVMSALQASQPNKWWHKRPFSLFLALRGGEPSVDNRQHVDLDRVILAANVSWELSPYALNESAREWYESIDIADQRVKFTEDGSVILPDGRTILLTDMR